MMNEPFWPLDPGNQRFSVCVFFGKLKLCEMSKENQEKFA